MVGIDNLTRSSFSTLNTTECCGMDHFLQRSWIEKEMTAENLTEVICQAVLCAAISSEDFIANFVGSVLVKEFLSSIFKYFNEGCTFLDAPSAT